MKVLMISKALVSRAYRLKLQEISRLGVEVHLVVPPSWDSIPLERGEGEEFRIYVLDIHLNGRHHFHFYSGLKKVFEQVMPDIVHIDEEHYSLVTFQAMRLARKYNVRALFSTWQNIYKRYPFPFFAIEQYNFRHAGLAIAGSLEVREVIRQKGFAGHVALIPLWVDPEVFRPMEKTELRNRLGVGSSAFNIGFVGRFVEEKGVQDLIDAVSTLEGDTTLMLLGSGPLEKEYMRRAEERGMGGRLRIIHSVPSTEVPEYMNCLDCLVLPSLTRKNWKEQFGRVLIEAMACEVPVVGSSSGEIPAVIGDAGLVFREGESHDLALKLKTLQDSPELRSELGGKGRKRVLELYTKQRIARLTVDEYERLLQ